MSGDAERALTEGLAARAARALWEGLLAGLFAAVVVAIAYLPFDLYRGSPLWTPALLGALFFEGVEHAQPGLVTGDLVVRFTLLHVVLWMGAGVFSSCLVSLGERFPRLWYLVFSLIVFLLSSALYLAGVFSTPGLPSLHLWLSVLLGSAAVILFLARRHPGAIRHLKPILVTETARLDIENALAQEYRSRALYRAAAAAVPTNAAITRLVEVADSRVHSLLKLLERLDLPRPDAPPEAEPPGAPVDAVSTLRAAMRLEEQKVNLYDGFLISVSEYTIHSVFLSLAAESQDRLIPEIRRHLPDGEDTQE